MECKFELNKETTRSVVKQKNFSLDDQMNFNALNYENPTLHIAFQWQLTG